MLLQVGGGDVEHVADVLGELASADLVDGPVGLRRDDQLQKLVDDAPAVGEVVAGGLILRHAAVEDVLHRVGGIVDELGHRACPLGQDEIARVLAGGDRGHPHLQLLADEHLQRPLGGGRAGGVGVEHQHRLVGEAADQPNVPVGQGRAHRGHYAFHARLQRDQRVEIAFNDDGPAAVADRIARPVEPVQLAGLVEQQRVGAVDVLGLFVIGQRPPAEADRIARQVEDREHQPIAEPVVAAGRALAADRQPGGRQDGFADALSPGGRRQRIP